MKLSTILQKKAPGTTVRATAQLIECIDSVDRNFQNCTDLFLSNNLIKDISKIVQFYNLSRLMIEFNQITRTNDLQPLKKLARLTELKILGNPICNYPLYESYLIYWCKRLTSLNGKQVNRELEKDAIYDIEISKDIYYSTLVLQIFHIKSLNLDKDKTISKIIQFLGQSKEETFRDQLESKSPKDIKQYFEYIKKLVTQVQNQISKIISGSNEDFAYDHIDNIPIFDISQDLQSLSEICQKQIVIDLNLIGIHNDKPFTKSLLKSARPNKKVLTILNDFERIAKQYKILSSLKKKKKTIVKNTRKMFKYHVATKDINFRKMRRNIRMQTYLDPLIRSKLEKDLNKKIMDALKYHKTKVIFNPNGLLTKAVRNKKIPNDIKMQRLKKRLEFLEEFKACENRGLSFEMQLKQEIRSQKNGYDDLSTQLAYNDLLELGTPRRREIKKIPKRKRSSQIIEAPLNLLDPNLTQPNQTQQIQDLATEVLQGFTEFSQAIENKTPSIQLGPVPRRSERSHSFVQGKHNSLESKIEHPPQRRCPLPSIPQINTNHVSNSDSLSSASSFVSSDQFVNDFLNAPRPEIKRRRKRLSSISLESPPPDILT